MRRGSPCRTRLLLASYMLLEARLRQGLEERYVHGGYLWAEVCHHTLPLWVSQKCVIEFPVRPHVRERSEVRIITPTLADSHGPDAYRLASVLLNQFQIRANRFR